MTASTTLSPQDDAMTTLQQFDAATLGGRYQELRAVQLGAREGWYQYAAGELDRGRHILDLGDGYRTLLRGELLWWVLGMADGWGQGRLVTRLLEEQPPQLLTIAEAATRIPRATGGGHLTPSGVEYLLQSGVLYPMYGPQPQGRTRFVFAAQADAVAASRSGADGDPVRVWRDMRALLPPAIRPGDLNELPPTSNGELGIPEGRTAGDRRVLALMRAHEQGLCEYDHPGDGWYLAWVVAGARRRRRVLPAAGVLPWVLGLADRAGLGGGFRYRRGL